MAEPTIQQSNGDRIPLREFIEQAANGRWDAHLREHDNVIIAADKARVEHDKAHDREHSFTADAVKKAEESINRAVETAKDANDKRFDEFDKTIQSARDLAQQAATRDGIIALEKSIIERMDRGERENNRRLSELERGASNMAGRMWALGIVLVIAMALLRFLPGGG